MYVYVSERNSVVVGSIPTQANFVQLLQIILQWCFFLNQEKKLSKNFRLLLLYLIYI